MKHLVNSGKKHGCASSDNATRSVGLEELEEKHTQVQELAREKASEASRLEMQLHEKHEMTKAAAASRTAHDRSVLCIHQKRSRHPPRQTAAAVHFL